MLVPEMGIVSRALLLVAVLGSTAVAKSVVVYYDRAFDNSWLAAEVDVLEVEVGAWMTWGGKRGRVKVRVTSDPSRIYRGWAELGRTLELLPPANAAQTCTAGLRRYEGSEQKVLLVVDSNRVIALGGEPVDDRYLLRSWCDNTACLLRPAGVGFGEVVQHQRADRLSVTPAVLAQRYEAQRRKFWARVTRFLDKEPPAQTRAAVAGWIRDLSASDPARRERAQNNLRTQAKLHVGTLREAARKERDPEVRRRLLAALASLRNQAGAHEVAERLSNGSFRAQAYVVREGMTRLTGSALTHARAYLKAIEAYVEED